MSRRCRRLRRMANQAVEVVRRLARICDCCGAMTEETQSQIVPLACVMSGTGSLKSPPISHAEVPRGICLSCCCPCRKSTKQKDSLCSFGFEDVTPQPLRKTSKQDETILLTCEFTSPGTSHSFEDRTPSPTKDMFTKNASSFDCTNAVSNNGDLSEEAPKPVQVSVEVHAIPSSVRLDDGNTNILDQDLNVLASNSSLYLKAASSALSLVSSRPHDAEDKFPALPDSTLKLTRKEALIGIYRNGGTLCTSERNVVNLDPKEIEKPQDLKDSEFTLTGKESLLNIEENYDIRGENISQKFKEKVDKITKVDGTEEEDIPKDFYLKANKDKLDKDAKSGKAVKIRLPRSSSLIASLSQSSQTDDSVALRFLIRKPYLGTSSFPACSHCAMGLSPQQKYEKYFRVNPVPECPDSETTLEMARRHACGPQNGVQMNGDSVTRPKYKGLTLKFPLSEFACGPVTAPPDLRVEYAINKEWHRIYPIEWSIQQNITKHGSGVVDLAMLGEYNKQIALKTMDTKKGRREAELIIACQGPFVVQLCACLIQGDTRYLCMTYYERRDLALWLKRDEKRKYFGPLESLWICGYILAAIEFLHNLEILHLDIKPGNILIQNNGYPVVGDFGSSRRMNEFKDGIRERFAFTLAYASPEVLAGVKPSRLADLWPLACIFYELLTGRTPFRRTHDIAVQLMQTLECRPNVSKLPADAQDFITSQLRTQLTERLGYTSGASEVMRHKVFKALDWAEIKYAHRHSTCRLLAIFKQIERDEREVKNKPDPLPPNPFLVGNKNILYQNSAPAGRWRLSRVQKTQARNLESLSRIPVSRPVPTDSEEQEEYLTATDDSR